MLYNILSKLKIKDQNKFIASIFGFFTMIIVAFIIVQTFTLFVVPDGRLPYHPDPVLYAIALVCPVFFYSYGVNSKLISGRDPRIKWFLINVFIFGAIVNSLIVTNINRVIWAILERLPTYDILVMEYPELFGPALKTLCFCIPFISLFSYVDYALLVLRDDDINKGVVGFCGMKVAKPDSGKGIFTCENETNSNVCICKQTTIQ